MKLQGKHSRASRMCPRGNTETKGVTTVLQH